MDSLAESPPGSVTNAGPLSSATDKLPLAVELVLDPVTVIARSSGLVLDPWQDQLARGREDTMVVNSRQSGKSTAACITVLAHVLSSIDALGIVISPTQRQSNHILRTCRKMLLKIPPAARPRLTKDTTTELRFQNGSVLTALPSGQLAGGANIRGLSPTLLIIEEGAYLSDQLYFDVLRPMSAVTRARVLILTSPSAAIGWCYNLFCSGSMKIISITAEQCPRISKKFLEREKATMPKSAFLREYMAKWVSVGAGIFDPDAIERAFQPIPNNPFRKVV
jgi:hypothetical protein